MQELQGFQGFKSMTTTEYCCLPASYSPQPRAAEGGQKLITFEGLAVEGTANPLFIPAS